MSNEHTMAAKPRVRLLVSVIAPEEAEAALAGGADIVDVKNPTEGSLGAAPPGVLRAIRARVPRPVSVSAALGDAPHLPGTMALAAAGAAGCGADYVKIGLLGSARPEQALDMLVAVRQAVVDANPTTRLIAVAYADAAGIGALSPAELPFIAREAGVHGVMLDTYAKDGVSTRTVLGDAAVASFVGQGKSLGLLTAVAGAVGRHDAEWVRRLDVDIVGVRGSVCEGGRHGTVSQARVLALGAAIRAPGQATAPSSVHLIPSGPERP